MTCGVRLQGTPKIDADTEIQTLHKMPPMLGYIQNVSWIHSNHDVPDIFSSRVTCTTGLFQINATVNSGFFVRNPSSVKRS